jgi:anti-sigma factor RsiW
MPSELTCQELVELVTDYFENALSEKARARVEAHLAGCEGCDRYVEQMRETIEMLGALKKEDVPPDAQEKLLEVFRDWRLM